MPAAAVTPAPVAYINAVAVKKLVVGSWRFVGFGPPRRRVLVPGLYMWQQRTAVLKCDGCFREGRPDWEVRGAVGHSASAGCAVALRAMFCLFHLEEIRVFKAALRRIEYCSMG